MASVKTGCASTRHTSGSCAEPSDDIARTIRQVPHRFRNIDPRPQSRPWATIASVARLVLLHALAVLDREHRRQVRRSCGSGSFAPSIGVQGEHRANFPRGSAGLSTSSRARHRRVRCRAPRTSGLVVSRTGASRNLCRFVLVHQPGVLHQGDAPMAPATAFDRSNVGHLAPPRRGCLQRIFPAVRRSRAMPIEAPVPPRLRGG